MQVGELYEWRGGGKVDRWRITRIDDEVHLENVANSDADSIEVGYTIRQFDRMVFDEEFVLVKPTNNIKRSDLVYLAYDAYKAGLDDMGYNNRKMDHKMMGDWVDRYLKGLARQRKDKT